MRRYLLVANETLLAEHLAEAVRSRMAAGDATFHVLVPATHGSRSWTRGAAVAAARPVLDAGVERFRALGAEVTGEIGDPSPVQAVGDALLAARYDEVILSTLPLGVSRWLRQDVVHRLRRAHPGLTITHVAAAPAPVG